MVWARPSVRHSAQVVTLQARYAISREFNSRNDGYSCNVFSFLGDQKCTTIDELYYWRLCNLGDILLIYLFNNPADTKSSKNAGRTALYKEQEEGLSSFLGEGREISGINT